MMHQSKIFLNGIKDDQVRQDCWTIVEIMQNATKAKPEMWGFSIVGFGSQRLKYASGRELNWMLIAFAPRKQNMALHIDAGFEGYDTLLGKLGKHACGKSCLNINDFRTFICQRSRN
jgi:hypothetical protein